MNGGLPTMTSNPPISRRQIEPSVAVTRNTSGNSISQWNADKDGSSPAENLDQLFDLLPQQGLVGTSILSSR